MSDETITDRVRERYAAAALSVREREQASDASCCGSGCCADPVTANLYTAGETDTLPEEAVLASLGCGNPTTLIDLHEGERVLDLGSGGGIDVLLSARRVGPTGFVYGVDMTDEMLALAEENRAKAGVTNVAFLKGRIEEIPLPPGSVDVVISNCVINLAADKSLVLRDAYRVLKPGGRFAVADVVSEGPVPDSLRLTMEAWVGCIAGALDTATYTQLLEQAGFEDVSIEITRRYRVADAGLDTSTLPAGWEEADGKIAGAFVRAVKPAVPAASSEPPTVSVSEQCCDTWCCGRIELSRSVDRADAPPVACTLTPEEQATRREDNTDLFVRALLAREPTATGLRLRFRRTAEVADEVEEFVRTEQQCCAFIDFAVDARGDEIWVDLNVEPEARPVLESLFGT